jgi:hypothetical protein
LPGGPVRATDRVDGVRLRRPGAGWTRGALRIPAVRPLQVGQARSPGDPGSLVGRSHPVRPLDGPDRVALGR